MTAGDQPRLLLIAPPSSYRIAPFVRAAQQLGVPLLIASQGRHSLVSEVATGLHVDFHRPDQALSRLLGEHRRWPFAGVVGSDDATVELASQVAAALGLPHNPPLSSRLSRRKDLARAQLARSGVPVPGHRLIDLYGDLPRQLDGWSYPCVVKPLSLSGSRGVIRADDLDALLKACQRITPLLVDVEDAFERTHVLVESFIPGREVAMEGMLAAGRLQLLALFDKPDDLNGPYFEETYYVTPSRLPEAVQQRVLDRVQAACDAYGLVEGPIHAEVRVNDADVWILEVAARTIGGQCAQLLRFGTGVGLEELVLMHAMGRGSVSFESNASRTAAGVLMIPIPRAGVLRRVEGILSAQRVPGIESIEISVREGYPLLPLPEGSSYLGFIFARAQTPDVVESALRAAHACLNIVTAPVVPLLSA